MNIPLSIYAFGGLTLHYDGQKVTGLASRKMEALMLYLIYTDHPHTREQLSDLFWSDVPLGQGLGNLRVVLTRLRKVFPHLLSVSRQTVGIASDAVVNCDARRVRQTLETLLDHWRAAGKLLPEEIAQLEQALMLYKGAFLAGVSMKGAAGFDDWVDVERGRLSGLILDGGQALITLYRNQHDDVKVLRVAQHLLQIDPLLESTHMSIMEAYWLLDQRERALAQYAVLSTALHRELEVAPSEKVRALTERIQTNDPPKRKSFNQPIELPSYPSAFIGRAREVEEITGFLNQPYCRLLTLLGIGGAGKTRLALAAAQASMDSALFPDGVYFVSLETVDSVNALITAVISTMRLEGYTIQTQAQLQNYLVNRKVLLVLDNFEHLLDSTPLLTDLLKAAPGIKLLATSRERLNLQEEWIYDVGGLECPHSVMALDSSDASRLLIASSQRVGVRLSLQHEPDSIFQLCHLVSGLPLALEMSAALLRDVRPAELVHLIKADLDTLRSSLSNIPERQRSLRALFDHAWGRLSESDRVILAQLTAFQGSFTVQAALSVTGANQASIERLRAKALLQLREDQRYTLHPVIRQYASEALMAMTSHWHQTGNAHADFFAQTLINQQESLFTPQFRAACTVLEQDEENIATAWRWYVQHHSADALMAMIHELTQWLMLTDKYLYADTLMDTTLELLPYTPEMGVVRGWVLSHGFRFKQALRRPENREALIECALSDFATAGDLRGQAYLLRLIASQQSGLLGQTQKGMETIEQSLALYAQCDDADGCAEALLVSASLNSLMGHYEVSRATFEQIFRTETQNPMILPDIYWKLGMNEFHRERFNDSLPYYEQALEFDRKCGFEGHYAKVLLIYGSALMELKRFDEAEQAFRQAMTFYLNIGHQSYTAACYERIGELLIQKGDVEESYGYYQQAVTIYRSKNIILGVMDTLTNFGNTCVMKRVLLPEGKAALLESLALSRQHQNDYSTIRTLYILANIHVLLGDVEDVPAYIIEAAHMASAANNQRELMNVFYVLGLYAQFVGMNDLARRAANVVIAHASTTDSTCESAKTLLAQLPEDGVNALENPELAALVEGY